MSRNVGGGVLVTGVVQNLPLLVYENIYDDAVKRGAFTGSFDQFLQSMRSGLPVSNEEFKSLVASEVAKVLSASSGNVQTGPKDTGSEKPAEGTDGAGSNPQVSEDAADTAGSDATQPNPSDTGTETGNTGSTADAGRQPDSGSPADTSGVSDEFLNSILNN